MKLLQIRNVPDDVHRTLKSRAALAGMSLSEYALAELRRAAERPTRDEILARDRVPPEEPAPEIAGRRRPSGAGRPLIVLDASAVIELLLNTDGGSRVRDRVSDPGESLHAPHLLSVEVAQVLRRYVTAQSISAETAESALEDLVAIDVAHYAHEPFLRRAWELRDNVTIYDGVYLALAEVLDAPLLTFDGRLAAAPGHVATVEVLR